EDFFRRNVPQHRQVSHPHKHLQHLAGRFLLQFLFPSFPYELIQIADTRKPYLADEAYHFSISHCGDYAAAIVSTQCRVGIDIEIPVPKINAVRNKFLSPRELALWDTNPASPAHLEDLTLAWSAKEAVFKWYGLGQVDFSEHIRLQVRDEAQQSFDTFFSKTNSQLQVHFRRLPPLVLSWVYSA
ncbi:MAG TPA: 4'-phosphopantetheinyl transferase superfamily protein, partial [Chitinophagaceae bacterium]|nr:4'-phosphopantetheinyl transferase superfamily protein [Chitinophagaceae bacterium]